MTGLWMLAAVWLPSLLVYAAYAVRLARFCSRTARAAEDAALLAEEAGLRADESVQRARDGLNAYRSRPTCTPSWRP